MQNIQEKNERENTSGTSRFIERYSPHELVACGFAEELEDYLKAKEDSIPANICMEIMRALKIAP